MTKADLAAKVAEKTGLAKKEAEKAVSAVFESITDALNAGEKIGITGFGSFGVKDRPARTCINPATKKPIDVEATCVPVFKAGKGLRDGVAALAKK